MGSNGRTESNTTAVLKPLLNGCLTGKLHGLYDWCRHSITNDFAQSALKKQQQKSLWKRKLFGHAVCSMASLGTYEILTDRLKNDNEGRPLSLYQDACCGLISGYTTMLVWHPFELASSRVGIHSLTYTNWFTTLAHILQNEALSSLWRGSFFNMSRSAAAYMGMLASYDRSRNYFIQTEGLSKWQMAVLYLDSFLQLLLIQSTTWGLSQMLCRRESLLIQIFHVLSVQLSLLTAASTSTLDSFIDSTMLLPFVWYNMAFMKVFVEWSGPSRTLCSTAPPAATGMGKQYISFAIASYQSPQ